MLRVFRSIWPINIRTQMMLWYTLIFAILIFLFGAVFYINLQTSLETNIDAELQQHAQEIANGINDDNGTITVEDVTGVLPGLTDPDKATPEPSPTSTAIKTGPAQVPLNVDIGPLVRILNNTGQAIYTSPTFLNLALPASIG